MDAAQTRLTQEATPIPLPIYWQEGTIYAALCFGAALLNFASQLIFSHTLNEGEFGNLNATLGVVGLFGVPLLAINQALTHHLAQYQNDGKIAEIAHLRASALRVLETAAIIFGILSISTVSITQKFFSIPRLTLASSALIAVIISLGMTVNGAFYAGLNRFRTWGFLLLGASLTRLILGYLLCSRYPWAETGVLTIALAWLIPLSPLLIRKEEAISIVTAYRTFLQPKFLGYLGACFSVTFALFVFAYGDQIIAQRWFSKNHSDQLAIILPDVYDGYQAAGLLGRALIWGTAPLLAVYFSQRSRLKHTTKQSLHLVWVYLATLIFGMIALKVLANPLSHLFHTTGSSYICNFIPWFAQDMFAIGLVQLAGIYALASRRYPECYTLGVCSLLYAAILFAFARQPELMFAYMFGGAACTLFIVFFLGIVRWSRARR